MDTRAALLKAIHEEPGDWTNWLVLADWLEEGGSDLRGEVLRLYVELRNLPWGKLPVRQKRRLLRLLAQGVRPCLPTITNSFGMTFVLVPPGTFWMGPGTKEPEHFDDELPQHEVMITRPFYLGVHQVTQAQWSRLAGDNPSYFREGGPLAEPVRGLDTSSFPVENVSWADARDFCRRLSRRAAERKAGRKYRLPTEAEWEYACRAGISAQQFFLRDTLRPGHANFEFDGERCLHRTCVVGSYPPNALGLCDMHGNVWEWCADWFDPDYYRSSPRQDPRGPPRGINRVFRGGAWRSEPRICRTACRSADAADFRDDYIGVRVALDWDRGLEVSGALG